MTTKIILLTDLHISEQDDKNNSRHLANLRAAVDDICKQHADAHSVFVMGDVADDGKERSYLLAKKELDRLPVPMHITRGNHDHADNMRRVFRHLPPGFMHSVHPTPAGDVVLADSVRENEEAGGFCQERCEWLQDVLQKASRPVFICMHHPPMFIPFLQDDKFAGEHFTQLESIVKEHADKIRHLFLGHLHSTTNGMWQGVPFTVLRSTGRQTMFTPDPANNNVAYTRAAPHYGILLADCETIIFHHHGYLENIPE